MSDYLFLLESHLDAGQNQAVAAMHRLATAADMNVWLTGGAMRDMLRGAPFRDLDFTVEREAVKTGKALAAALNGKVTAEDSLKRWVEIELPGGITASVSNARTEKYAKFGAKPQIAPATIHEDLSRRDFTVNAIALSLSRGSRGLLVDPVNGQADIVNRELRATNPYIFFDDPARIFRLIRFRHVLGYELIPRTQSQLENALLEGFHESAGREFLAHEIRALAHEPTAVAALDDYDSHGLLKVLSPGFTGAKLNAAGLTKFEKVRQSAVPAGTPGGWLAFLTVLTEKLSAREKADVLKAFAMGSAEMADFKKLEASAKKLEGALKSARIRRPSDVWHVLHPAASDEVLLVLYSSGIRVVQDRIRAFYEKYLPQSREITEEQVLATGAKPGTPKFQKTFDSLITTRLNARPRKVVEPEVIVEAPAQAAAMATRGRKQA
jgi:tRNA nucleotidyltransferase (CCA-adding enzyme)